MVGGGGEEGVGRRMVGGDGEDVGGDSRRV